MTKAPKSSARADKILQAAGQLFARQGYYATTTREIARLAEVSENTLFRHFENKEDLFWASLDSYSAGFKFRRDVLEGLTAGHPPEARKSGRILSGKPFAGVLGHQWIFGNEHQNRQDS